MSNFRHPNFTLCDLLIRLPDGSLTSPEMEHQQRYAWRDDVYPINAEPDRMKICMFCQRSLPIADFLIEGNPSRTILKKNRDEEWFAYVVADVRMWCIECETMIHEND